MKIYELIPPKGIDAFIIRFIIDGKAYTLYYDHMALLFDNKGIFPSGVYTEITADDFIEQLVEYNIPLEEIIKKVFI